jgi:DNA polymerase III subunit alpha
MISSSRNHNVTHIALSPSTSNITPMSFVHLHVHSHYSLLDGACKIGDLKTAAERHEMPALALTDHGNMFGAIEFYKTFKKSDVKPIIGMEAYIAPGRRQDRVKDPVSAFHLVLLCKDLTGYANLMKLASAAYTEGFYYNPRIDKELLAQHAEGLIATSACLKGEASFYMRAGQKDRGTEIHDTYRQIFGDDYFIELMDHGLPEQAAVNEANLAAAKELRIPVIATNDIHYLTREDAAAHDALLCLSTGKVVADENRMRYPAQEFYFKSGKEMSEIFRDVPEAIDNTQRIADACNLEITFGEMHLPNFEPETGEDNTDYFHRLCREGVERRYGDITPEIEERLEVESEVITSMDYVSYFLIVWDFIRYAKTIGVPVGPGRGSAAGSIVAYALGITDIDPLKYDLLFERFLNKARVSMPDIDIDFCRDRRADVIQYVNEKYGGPANVSQIITFGTMAARAAIRDVGRVLSIPLPEVDRIAKMIPAGPGVKLGESIEQDPDLKALSQDPAYRDLFDIARRLEGTCRHASTHAAGVVISDGPLDNYVPLHESKGEVTTQYSMDHLEDIGLLKMDFLGLKTLTVLDKALAAVKRRHGLEIDFDTMGLKDAPTFDLLRRGDALGVFQLESEGMRELLQRLKPDCFEDLIAILALYRPGPLGSGMVESYILRKHGKEEVSYPHPTLEEVLKETYGVCVYQEQVMRVANRLGGFTLNEADNLRKAMGKKKPEVMALYRTQFIDGAVAQDCPKATAQEVWSQLEFFAGYGFNKSHTAAYAVISYRTAWLKANYPAEFLAALMSCDMGTTDKVVLYLDECRKTGLQVLPPSLDESLVDFHVTDEGIRFGLGAVKGVGTCAAAEIVRARAEKGEPFGSIFEFCETVDLHAVNRSATEALIKAGAFDGLGGHRGQIFQGLDAAMRVGNQAQADRRAGQMGLFGAASSDAPEESKTTGGLPEVDEWPEREVLAFEKEALGFYLTSHPLARHADTVARFSTTTTGGLAALPDRARVILAGMVREPREKIIKQGRYKNRKMGFMRLEDLEGSAGAVLFADAYARYGELIGDEAIVFVEGAVDQTRDEPNIKVERVIPLDRAAQALASSVTLRLPSADPGRALTPLHSLMERNRGGCPVFLEVPSKGSVRAVIRVAPSLSVLPTRDFLTEAETLLGAGAITLGGGRNGSA